MAGQVAASPTFALTPSSERTPTAENYIVNFDFLNQYLPDTYEKEFERYGNRTISSFLRMVGAEMPTNSDLIKWAEQGRLHTKYTQVGTAALVNADQVIKELRGGAPYTDEAGTQHPANIFSVWSVDELKTLFVELKMHAPTQVASMQELLDNRDFIALLDCLSQ